MKKLLLKSSGEKVDDEKRIDLLFQALDKLKEAEIMVSQHILSDTDTLILRQMRIEILILILFLSDTDTFRLILIPAHVSTDTDTFLSNTDTNTYYFRVCRI